MTRLLLLAVTITAAAAVLALPAAATTDYRIRIMACTSGAPGAGDVPANTPLFVRAGWITGTRGLVQDAVQADASTVLEVRNRITTVHRLAWGPIEPIATDLGPAWASFFHVDIAPLGVGETATLTQTIAFSHPLIDLELSNEGGGLVYLNHVAGGVLPGSPDFTNPATCAITGV